MKQSVLIPVTNHGFEINYFNKKNDAWDLFNQLNESSEKLSKIENLFRLHQHDVMELLVFLDGECEFFCEGKTYSLKRGDIVVIPPYAVHQATVKNFRHYERIIVSISRPLMNEFMTSSTSLKENIVNQKTQGSYVLHLHSNNFQDIISLLQEVARKIHDSEDHQSFSLNYLLFQALQIIFDPASSMPNLHLKNELDHRFVSVLEYIDAHLTEPDLSLDRISSFFHLNKYYFSHYFKSNMNLPFYRYVSLKRLSFALSMIKDNQMSIEEIALKCGFTDYSSFYRLFKKEYNLSPKKLQKE